MSSGEVFRNRPVNNITSVKKNRNTSTFMEHTLLVILIIITLINIILLLCYTDVVKNVQATSTFKWGSKQMTRAIRTTQRKFPDVYKMSLWAFTNKYVVSLTDWNLERIFRMPIVKEFINDKTTDLTDNVSNVIARKVSRIGDNFIWMVQNTSTESVINLYISIFLLKSLLVQHIYTDIIGSVFIAFTNDIYNISDKLYIRSQINSDTKRLIIYTEKIITKLKKIHQAIRKEVFPKPEYYKIKQYQKSCRTNN